MVNLALLTPEQCDKIRALATEPNPDDLLGMGEDYFGADIVLALLDTIDQLRENA
ncbi:hypothetical protein [Brachybacterium sp. AOP3-A1-3]|uniref:hypothetical protein n=1 Tax=Brachybacterium sp. AOP3-A1-3 TaxID=3457699 RepID=UPI0040342662